MGPMNTWEKYFMGIIHHTCSKWGKWDEHDKSQEGESLTGGKYWNVLTAVSLL